MPEKSGYWLIGKVRSLQHLQTRKIPAIAFTGEEKAFEKVITSGFQSYIQKPSSPTELITEVTKLLSVKSNRFFLH
jgi:CheY-like chemotaxis protein